MVSEDFLINFYGSLGANHPGYRCDDGQFEPQGHLLGKGRPLGSRLWCLTLSLSLSHWYPGSGVVLDCIDS